MINHQAAQLALRTKLLTLPTIVTTGSMSLAATATGYVRSSGSFVTDGFFPGMEVTPVGFANLTPRTITKVTATTLTTATAPTVESVSAGRTLVVGLPAQRAWENVQFSPAGLVPYVSEQYVPGPMRKISVGPLGELEIDPMYVVHVHVPSGFDFSAGASYADAILSLFAPSTSLTLTNAAFWVRGDVAPYRGQALQLASGFSVVPINIPLRIRTANNV